MSTIDYQPVLDGEPYDPVPAGGSVSALTFFTEADYSDPSPVTTGPATRISAGVYRFTLPTLPAGRYWPQVTWTKDGSALPFNDRLPEPLDLPVRDDLVVSPEALAVSLGVALPLDAAQRQTLTDVILDAQADVRGYLKRAILPELVVERVVWPYSGVEVVLKEQPVVEVVSTVEEFDASGFQTGYWTVTYRAGLDVRNDPALRPIKRLLVAHAKAHPDAVALWRTAGGGSTAGVGKRIKAVSAEGQSVSYDYLGPDGQATGAAGVGAVGGPVRWESIDTWRLGGRRVFQRRAPAYWVR